MTRFFQWIKVLSSSISTNVAMSQVKRLLSEQEIRYICAGLHEQ